MRFKNIAFFGDSFTWGEGLELYCDTPKWITQRQLKSQWIDLQPLQDEDSITFRETNRFSSIVSRHFNAKLYTIQNNGGSLQYTLMHTLPILHKIEKSEVIISQFSCLNRDTIHLPNEKEGICNCKLCEDFSAKFKTHLSLSNIAPLILRSELDRWYDDSVLLDLKNEIQSKYKINLDGDATDILSAYQQLQTLVYSNNINHYFNKYSKDFETKNIFTFFIDSWDRESSDVLFENEYFLKNLIPLIGYDGNYYQKYSQWESTFPYTRIINEFPKVMNSHPTLLQHQYIAKSVIEFLEKKEVKKQIKYI
jgi:hypothetical protein